MLLEPQTLRSRGKNVLFLSISNEEYITMDKHELKIVFMGTPDFAVASLRALVEGGYRVVGVVTMPDKPMGRHGSVLQPSPVKRYAEAQGLTLLQPERLRDPAFLDALRALGADLQIVVAFRMLPQAVWEMPRLGTFNLHASLLPRYRGAAPINWAVINGEKETGVTTFFLRHAIDTGRIILQRRLPIDEADDAGTVHDRLMAIGAELLTETVDRILEGDGHVETTEQDALLTDASALPTAPKIFRDTCHIDWEQPTGRIYNFIRGLAPHPAAWTEILSADGRRSALKIFRSEPLTETHELSPGAIRTDGRHLDVATRDGFLRLLEVQPAGKRRMAADQFLNGTDVAACCMT